MLRVTLHFLIRYTERRGVSRRQARKQIERDFAKTRHLPREEAQRLLGGHLHHVGHYRTDGVGIWVIENTVGGQTAITYLTPQAVQGANVAQG